MGDFESVLRIVRQLGARPRWEWSKEHRDDLRGERALPLLCLIGGADRTKAVADALGARLHTAPTHQDNPPRRLIPAAVVDARQVPPDGLENPPLLPLLNLVAQALGEDRYGLGREIPFHTFRLVDWLTTHTAATLERDQQAPVRSNLHEWYSSQAREADGGEPISQVLAPIVPDKALAVGRAVPRLVSRLVRWLWLNGLRSGEPRWLMRQPFAGPRHSASFLRFARRLSVDRRKYENVDQVKLLLVHAFLRDLRLFYGTGTWWLRRWRRTAYPTVVLRDITEDNGGWDLLRLVNDVRNLTGEHDPLLVVATAADVPADLDLAVAPESAAEAQVAAWQRELPWNRQKLRPSARFVAVRLDDAPTGAATGADADADTAGGRLWEPPKMPWFAHGWAVTAAVVLLVLGAGTATVRALPEQVPDPCGVRGHGAAAATWVEGTKECVGYSGGGYVFGSTEKLRKAQAAVFEQNAQAEELHRANPRRPIVTLVYFAELTHPDTRAGTDDAEAEELTGLLIHQSQYNTVGNSVEDAQNPLLRVVVANGGYQMRHARRAVDDFIAPLAERDPTVMGVVGGGRTVAETESAIGSLGAHGIPMLATTLTGDTLPLLSPLYFQMVAGNGPQARLITDYAAATGRTVTVYHPDLAAEPDRYLQSLHDRFQELAPRLPTVRFRQWRTPSTVEVECRADDIAFYAGRETGFTDFLDHVLDACPAAAKPAIVGDDAITRIIAQGESRRSDSFAGVSLAYVSLADRVVLTGSSCVSEGRPSASGANPDDERPLTTFCAGLRGLYAPRADRPAAWKAFGAELSAHDGNQRWTGERVGVAYDAAGVYLTAVVHNKRRTVPDSDDLNPNRAAVGQEFRELDCTNPVSPWCFRGVSGRVDFRSGRDGRTRPLAILTIEDITATNLNPICTYRSEGADPCP